VNATLGFDIGGTNVRGVALGADDSVLHVQSMRRPGTWDELLGVLHGMTDGLRAAVKGVTVVDAIGVGIAGMVDHDGVMRYGPNLPGMEQAPVRRRCRTRRGCRSSSTTTRTPRRTARPCSARPVVAGTCCS
jgi:predicted NBD/HSP70 family sugar kinase